MMIKNYIVRTVRLIEPQNDHRFGQVRLTLNDFDSHHGVILLGDPEMGKSTEFDAATDGIDERHCISAREFRRYDPDDDPHWRIKTLFIDGLDEVRIGGGEPRTVMDQIITKIKGLGTPRFRLSFRPSSWFCTSDSREISSLLDINEIPALLLNPLNEDNVREVISQHRTDVDAFIQKAHELGLDGPIIFMTTARSFKIP